MRVVVLVNQYPKPSHSFVRREIDGLEAAGIDVVRVSIRGTADGLVDERDRAESERTRVILEQGLAALALQAAAVGLRHPIRWLRSLWLALGCGLRSSRGVGRHLAYLAEACFLARLCAREDVRHVHAHFVTNPTTVAMLCRTLGGPPYSFTAHGSNSFQDLRGTALAAKVARAEFAVAVSHNGRSQLLRIEGPAGGPPVHLVRCGVDELFLDHPASTPPEERRLVCVARLEYDKGVSFLLDAAGVLAAEGLSFELALVGEGSYRAELQRRTRDLGLEAHVRFEGMCSAREVRAHVLAARALVLPSLDEGLPVVLMEALALGRPVVATVVGAVPELVVHGDDGWLVPAADVAGLAAALREALTLPVSELAEMGRRGAAHVAERHDSRVEARRLAALLRRDAGEPGASA